MTDNKPTHEDELKACPFCGRKPIIGLGKKQGCQLHGEPMQSVTVSCSCEFHPAVHTGDINNGGKFKAQQEAIAKWNTRASTPPAPQAEGEVANAIRHAQLRLGDTNWREQYIRVGVEELKTLITAAEESGRLREELRIQDEANDILTKQVSELRLSLSKAEEHGRCTTAKLSDYTASELMAEYMRRDGC